MLRVRTVLPVRMPVDQLLVLCAETEHTMTSLDNQCAKQIAVLVRTLIQLKPRVLNALPSPTLLQLPVRPILTVLRPLVMLGHGLTTTSALHVLALMVPTPLSTPMPGQRIHARLPLLPVSLREGALCHPPQRRLLVPLV